MTTDHSGNVLSIRMPSLGTTLWRYRKDEKPLMHSDEEFGVTFRDWIIGFDKKRLMCMPAVGLSPVMPACLMHVDWAPLPADVMNFDW